MTEIAGAAVGYADDLLTIESLDIEAQGIAHRPDGKVVFVEGALPFETVSVNTYRKKSSFDKAVVTAIHRPSSQRVTPGCPHFGLHNGACGGCKMQHMHADGQVAVKQRVLEDNLWHLGKVRPEVVLRPIHGPTWGYRYRGRLSVRYVRKKGAVLIGFHERKSGYVADMQQCRVLPPFVSDLLMPLRGLIDGMQAREECAQIELAVGDDGPTQVVALVLRHMVGLSPSDRAMLRAFAQAQSRTVDGQTQLIQWWLQPGGLDTVAPLDADGPQLEGSQALVQRAQDNARINAAARAPGQALAPVAFVTRNLFEMTAQMLMADGVAQKWLMDPPREGAYALVQALALAHHALRHARGGELAPGVDVSALPAPGDWAMPQRIVYVSCNPATLARDASVLVQQAGYRCVGAGVVNMFAHTAHVESIAVFELGA